MLENFTLTKRTLLALQKHRKVVLKPHKNILYKNVIEDTTTQNFLKYQLSKLTLNH